MNDSDFLEIERKLEELARATGATDVMDQRHYRIDMPKDEQKREGRADRPMTSKERVIAEIQALERHLSLFDHGVYEEAMTRIHGVLRRDDFTLDVRLPPSAVIQMDAPDGSQGPHMNLSDLPELGHIRKALAKLALQLEEG